MSYKTLVGISPDLQPAAVDVKDEPVRCEVRRSTKVKVTRLRRYEYGQKHSENIGGQTSRSYRWTII